ncbi:MAG: type II toxin-antitoxin system VapC family toxin [Candidatus Gracilibacteria bacterium]|nr:type II toxin-antitoxin system VapC family toxin [bacterium]MDZ4217395.1 type II toxin-antitoxin system VapC family toxin [Candidatus Gracilibacteria bacterium]
MFLLDTCTLIWLAQKKDKLSPKVEKLLGSNEELLFVSVVSALEIGLLHQKQIIEFSSPLYHWWTQLLEFYEIQEIPISSTTAIRSTTLPLHHKDPSDRIIIATAIEKGLTILTPDKHIQAYPEVTTIW